MYPCPLHPIRAEDLINRLINRLLCLLIAAAHSCSDGESREGIANCKMGRKLAKMTTALTAVLMNKKCT